MNKYHCPRSCCFLNQQTWYQQENMNAETYMHRVIYFLQCYWKFFHFTVSFITTLTDWTNLCVNFFGLGQLLQNLRHAVILYFNILVQFYILQVFLLIQLYCIRILYADHINNVVVVDLSGNHGLDLSWESASLRIYFYFLLLRFYDWKLAYSVRAHHGHSPTSES